jgi:hypothetical protein
LVDLPGRRLEARTCFALFTIARIVNHAGLRQIAPRRVAEAMRDLLFRLVNAGSR